MYTKLTLTATCTVESGCRTPLTLSGAACAPAIADGAGCSTAEAADMVPEL